MFRRSCLAVVLLQGIALGAAAEPAVTPIPGVTAASGPSASGPSAPGPGPSAPAAETPPPSTYDLLRQQQDGKEPPVDESPGIIAQLGRTLLALLVVVGIIYGIGKLLTSRLGAFRMIGGGGRVLRLRERLALDNRHSLFVIDVEGGTSLIVGTGERGVQLVSTVALPPAPPNEQTGLRFRDLLVKPAKVAPKDPDKDGPHA
jgi:flagellar biogenesis protein FliO